MEPDDCPVGPECLRGDHQPVEHEVGTLPDERAVLAGQRLALGGVGHDGEWPLAQQCRAPLDRDGNERAAVSEQPRMLDVGEQGCRDVRAGTEAEYVVVVRLPLARGHAVRGAGRAEHDRTGQQGVGGDACRSEGHRLLRDATGVGVSLSSEPVSESTRSAGVRAV